MNLKLDARLKIKIKMHAPDNRKRDLDNIQKPILDALMHANVFMDDSQIDDLHTIRKPISPKNGHVVVEIYRTQQEKK